MADKENFDHLPPHLRGVVSTLTHACGVSNMKSDEGVILPVIQGASTSMASVSYPKQIKGSMKSNKHTDFKSIFKSIADSITMATETNKRLQLEASVPIPKAVPKSVAFQPCVESPPDSPQSTSTYATNDTGSPLTTKSTPHHLQSPITPTSTPGGLASLHKPITPPTEQERLELNGSPRSGSSYSVSVTYKNGKHIIFAEAYPDLVIEAEAPDAIRVRTMEPLTPTGLPEYEIDVLYDNMRCFTPPETPECPPRDEHNHSPLGCSNNQEHVPIDEHTHVISEHPNSQEDLFPLDEYTKAPSECLNDQEHIWDDTAPNSPELTAQPIFGENNMALDFPKLEPISILASSNAISETKQDMSPEPTSMASVPASSNAVCETKQDMVPEPASIAAAPTELGEVKEVKSAKAAEPKAVKPPNTRIYASALLRWRDLKFTEQFSIGYDKNSIREPSKADLEAKLSKNFPCNNEHCAAGFDTARGLKSHKDQFHDFCKVCNLDFENATEYHIHKLEEWEKHSTCPLCSEDFGSIGGRDRHIKLVSFCPMSFHH